MSVKLRLLHAICFALIISTVDVSVCSAQSKLVDYSKTKTINGFLFGRVTALTPGRAVTNIGYADRIRNYTQVSVFRYRGKDLEAVASIRLNDLDAVSSAGNIIGARTLKIGDIVVVPLIHTVSLTKGKSLEGYVAKSAMVDREINQRYSTLNNETVARKILDQDSRLRRYHAHEYDKLYSVSPTRALNLYEREQKRIEKQPNNADRAENLLFLKMSVAIRKALTEYRTNQRAEFEMTVGQLAAMKALGREKGARIEKPKETKKEKTELY